MSRLNLNTPNVRLQLIFSAIQPPYPRAFGRRGHLPIERIVFDSNRLCNLNREPVQEVQEAPADRRLKAAT